MTTGTALPVTQLRTLELRRFIVGAFWTAETLWPTRLDQLRLALCLHPVLRCLSSGKTAPFETEV